MLIHPLSLAVWFMDDGGKGGNTKNSINTPPNGGGLFQFTSFQIMKYTFYKIVY